MLNKILRVVSTPSASSRSPGYTRHSSAAMKVTKDIQQKIIRELAKKEWNLSEFSEKLGKHRTWATKLLSKNATISELTQDTADHISDLLGISLRPIHTIAGNVSHTAIELSRSAEKDARIAQLLEIVFDLANPEPDTAAHIPIVETKELTRIGSEITKIVHRLESGKGDYSPKIGSEVLSYLREYFAKVESKGKK